jgi:hypothetical protein
MAFKVEEFVTLAFTRQEKKKVWKLYMIRNQRLRICKFQFTYNFVRYPSISWYKSVGAGAGYDVGDNEYALVSSFSLNIHLVYSANIKLIGPFE